MERKSKVYIKVNRNFEVVAINSENFITDKYGWIAIDEGLGDKYFHSQSHYLAKPLINENGKYNYKYINGKVSEI
jgi:hypothetical protein